MAKTLGDHLLNTLEELLPYDFEKFKFKLQNTSLEKGHSKIPRGHMQMARPVKLASLLITYYGEEYAVRLTLQILRATNQRQLAEELRKATGTEHLIEENRVGGSVQSSVENKAKSVKVPDVPEGDGTQQNNDESDTLPSSQAEVGKGPQKKSLTKRKDQRGPESLDSQTKPWTRSTAPLYRRTQGTQSPGDKESTASAQLRRNVSSAGRLQGLYNNAPGRRESKKAEVYVYLPSGKKRPRSLEITTYSREGEPPNSEVLPTQEETRNGSLIRMRTATLNGRTTGALEKGTGIPEHSMVLDEKTFRNMSSKTSLIGEERCPTSWTENGNGSPETTESSGETAGSILSDPEVPLSLCEKPAKTPEDPASLGQAACEGTLLQVSRKCDAGPEKCTFTHLALQVASNFGRSQDKAVCPLCHTQEGDLRGDTCVQSSCSCSIAPGDPKASGRCSICFQCQGLLARKSCEAQSPQSLPQCPRHMKQVLLLFCEDHREPICLICRLSLEHQGHRVRPIEEAALEYKEQIREQLERLREMRGYVEEHRLQGDKKTDDFLKQTEIQKQKISCPLEKLYQLLEKQEQLFVTWLQELSQTISKVRETYYTRVSLLDEMIEELEAKQDQPEWDLMQDIGITLHRAKMMSASELLDTPPGVKEKLHLLYQKSKSVEKNMQCFSEMLSSEMAFSASDVAKWEGRQPSATQVQGLVPTVHLKCDGAHTQDCDVVFYPEREAGGSEPKDYLHPQPAQDTPELHEIHSRNNKRKFKSFLKWKPSFLP
ncbi:pyrin isoform X3 [Mus musculus]|uniref:pyrin isoform X3 n=1 Tax=Mus musculus TaxID=10090 RepID=UPI0011AE4827|nr:pyrin isoform X3 [Mus musculus]